MLLAIDVGNTQTVVGLFNGHELADHWRIATDANRTSDELALMIQQFLGFHGFSVRQLDHRRRDLVGRAARHRRAASDHGALLLASRARRRARRADGHADPVRQPEGGRRRPDRQRGRRVRPVRRARRSSSTSAPRPRSRRSARKGEYLGGAIFPGVEISLDALFERAAGLRRVELVAPKHVIGKSTVESIQSGAIYGFAAQVDGLVDRFAAELGECTVVATGGLAES